MNSTTTHVAVASGVSGALVGIGTWLLSLHNIAPPADVVVDITVLTNAAVTIVTSLIMKRMNP